MDMATNRYSTLFEENSSIALEDEFVKLTLDLYPSPPESNLSETELLESRLGPRYRSLAESLVLTLVYSSIFITGVAGNICTCIVICKNRYMHTATNYYLFSLAISDVLTLIIGLPPELVAVWKSYPWIFGEAYCLLKVFSTEMTYSASILTITSFTVERYVAICHPMRAQRMSSLNRATKIIFAIWLCAALTALPYPIHTRTFFYIHLPDGTPIYDSFICNIPAKWTSIMRVFFQFSTFLLFVLPMTVITVLYLMIGLALRRAMMLRNDSKEGQHQSRHSGKIPNMLVAVVVAFFICWAPFHAQRLMTIYIRDEQWTKPLMEVQNALWYISGVLYFVSSTVNPILYNLMSKKYRQAFKETLCTCCFKISTDYRPNGNTVYTFYSSSSKKHPARSQPGGNSLYSQMSVNSSQPFRSTLGSNAPNSNEQFKEGTRSALDCNKTKYRYSERYEMSSLAEKQPSNEHEIELDM